jgi:hypothetical protein
MINQKIYFAIWFFKMCVGGACYWIVLLLPSWMVFNRFYRWPVRYAGFYAYDLGFKCFLRRVING